jgi:hypothetical protein
MGTEWSSFSLAGFAAGVGLEIALGLWVFEFATEAIVLWHWLVVLDFALDAIPVVENFFFFVLEFVLVGFFYPLFDAF